MFLVRFVLWFLRFTGDITNEFIEKNVPFMCASISFYAFFSLFPFSSKLNQVPASSLFICLNIVLGAGVQRKVK